MSIEDRSTLERIRNVWNAGDGVAFPVKGILGMLEQMDIRLGDDITIDQCRRALKELSIKALECRKDLETIQGAMESATPKKT